MSNVLFMKNYAEAEQFKKQLEAQGVPSDEISIVVKSGSNAQPMSDDIGDALQNMSITVDDAPSGTVSAFGATFTVLSGVAAGALLLAIGPIAALAGGAAVAAGGATALFTGIGVPEEKHSEYEAFLERGDVLIVVDDEHSEAFKRELAA